MLVELLPQLKREGVNCSLLLFDREKTYFSTLLENEDIQIYYTARKSFFNLLNVMTFLNVIFSSKYDIIHCHLTYSQFWIALVSFFNFRRKKLITTEHSSNNRRRGNRFLCYVDKFIYSRFHRVISISEAVQSSLLDWIKPRNVSKYVVIENCIDIKKFRVFSMICYLVMGWCIVFKINLLPELLGTAGFVLLLLGGLAYTIGAILYGLGKKHKYMHSVFHLFILLGSLLQFFTILLYVM